MADTFEGKSMKLGGGGRFAKLQSTLEGEGKSKEAAGAIAAAVGRARYGAKKMASMATKGKARAAKSGGAGYSSY